MSSFKSQLSSSERIVLAIDTADEHEAEKLVALAKDCGAKYVKFGLQLASAKSWSWCAELAKKYDMQWIADAKISDIPNTVAMAVKALADLGNPPFGVTLHASCGSESLKLAKQNSGSVKLFAVTVLTSIDEAESRRIFGSTAKDKVIDLAKLAATSGIDGVVASPLEVAKIAENSETQELITLIPGSRSAGTSKNDQSRTMTPKETAEAGADLLVIGREITSSDDPKNAFDKIVKEIEVNANE